MVPLLFHRAERCQLFQLLARDIGLAVAGTAIPDEAFLKQAENGAPRDPVPNDGVVHGNEALRSLGVCI